MPTQQSPKRGLSFLSFHNLLNRMSHFELAQINIARFVQPKAHASNLPFMDALDAVNAEAEASPGFLWRLVGDGNNATDVEAVPGDSRLIVNMSVWSDMASLSAFAYRNKPMSLSSGANMNGSSRWRCRWRSGGCRRGIARLQRKA